MAFGDLRTLVALGVRTEREPPGTRGLSHACDVPVQHIDVDDEHRCDQSLGYFAHRNLSFLAHVPSGQTVPRAVRRVLIAWAIAASAAWVSRRASSITKSWMIPWYRTAVTATPASRSLAA